MTIPINLIISGGGIKFYYLIGMKLFIDKLIKNSLLKIIKYSSISSGSIFITLMACNIDSKEIIKKYRNCLSIKNISKLERIKFFLNSILPNNAHQLCNDRVYITTTLIYPKLMKKTFSKFDSKNNLINIILASSSFPIFINQNIYYSFNNYNYIDGCFSTNTPIVDYERPNLNIKLFFCGRINLFDIEKNNDKKEILTGYIDTKNFFLGNKIDSIEWYKNKSYLKRLLKYLLYVLKK